MKVRKRALPPGWYPQEPDAVREAVTTWTESSRHVASGDEIVSVVAPHAGWFFSGSLAAEAWSALPSVDTIALIGGHLSGREPPLVALEEAFDTPLGLVYADSQLRDEVALQLSQKDIKLGIDDEPDNTVEVHLPFCACLFPKSRVLWLRAPNGPAALELGRALYEAASSLGRSLVCVGSTDLTHYGPNYGFYPAGGGPAAESWVRNTNDKRFIDALLMLDGQRAIELGETEHSACSSGAAAAAVSFALSKGAKRARLLRYATSLDVRRDSSFVGYAALAFCR
jgi:hypothetical protein